MRWQRILAVLAVVLGLLLMLTVLTGTAKVFNIPTNGMAPTIRSGDSIVATRIFSPEKTVKKGDVVIFDANRATRPCARNSSSESWPWKATGSG